MTTAPPAAGQPAIEPAAERAAEEIVAFARLFEARLAAERAGEPRPPGNAAEMNALAPGVQRSLERVGRCWLQEPEGGRPTPLVHALAFGDATDYGPHVEEGLQALRAAERLYRSGQVTAGVRRRRRKRREISPRRLTQIQIAGVVTGALAVWAMILWTMGTWG